MSSRLAVVLMVGSFGSRVMERLFYADYIVVVDFTDVYHNGFYNLPSFSMSVRWRAEDISRPLTLVVLDSVGSAGHITKGPRTIMGGRRFEVIPPLHSQKVAAGPP